MPYIPDPVNEIVALYAWEGRQQGIQSQLDNIDAEQAFRVSLFGRFASWIHPGIAIPLGLEGFTPSDPVVQGISERALLTNNPYQAPGTTITGAQLFPGPHNKLQRFDPRDPGSVGSSSLSPDDEKLREDLTNLGFVPVDNMEINDELRLLLKSNASLISDDGFIHEPKNANTTKGKAFDKLVAAFDAAGVPLPYYDFEKQPVVRRPGSTKPSDPAEIANIERQYADNPTVKDSILRNYQRSLVTQPEIVNVGKELFPDSEESDGSSSLPGIFNTVRGPIRKATRSPNFQQSEQIERLSGMPVDPNDPMAPLAVFSKPAFMLMDAPQQELQGQIRNVIGAAHGKDVNWLESQSDLGVAIRATMDGKPIDVGDGFFVDPDSAVARERRRREAERGKVGRHNITLGRFLANQVTEPDTQPFRVLSGVVDAGVQLADPTAWAATKLGEVRLARDLFSPEATDEAVGLIAGLRHGIDGPRVSSWLNSDKGIDAINALTNEPSAARIWIAMNRQVDPRVAAKFAKASTPEETRSILESILGTTIRKRSEIEATVSNLTQDPFLSTINRLNPRTSQSRMLRWMPTAQLDTTDPRQFATQLERHMINAKVPEPVQLEILDEIAHSTGRNGLYTAATKAMKHEAGILASYGVNPDQASRLTRLFQNTFDAELQGLVDEVGEDVPVWTKMLMNGEEVEVPGPHLPLEHINRYIPLPDARAIRRLTSNKALRFLTTNTAPETFGQSRFPIALMDFVTQDIWKSGTLLGRFPAWVSRVVGESQIRMAAGGLDSMFRHPIDYFGYALGRKATLTPSGDTIEDIEQFQRSLSASHGGWLNRPGVTMSNRARLFKKLRADPIDFRNAWADQLALLSYDPVSKKLLNEGFDATKRWMLGTYEGHAIRKDLMQAHPGNLIDESGIERYLHTVSRRIQIMTGGNTDIIESLRTGKLALADKEISILHNVNRTNPKFSSWLDNHIDSAPDAVKGFDMDVRRGGIQFPERVNHVVDKLFAMTMGFADNLWDRAPTFKQFLWKHTRELMPFASVDAQAEILANARKANVPNRVLRSLERMAKHSAGDLSAKELDLLARGYAADSAKRLLYDLAEHGQLADAMRIITPFANAYQEIFGAWGKLLSDIGGPGITGKLTGLTKVSRRTQQIIQGARGEDFGAAMGSPDGEGFFFKDEFGQEVFVIPGSQFLTQAVTARSGGPGAAVPLTGSVQGLNMMGNILPGVGPVGAIPVAWMLQDKPQFDGIHDLLLPYGAPGERQPADVSQLLSYAPPWMRRAFDAATNGGYDQRQWANAQKDVMAYLYSTGRYDTSSREGMQELLQDAKSKTKDLYYIRSFAQSFSPTTPAFRFLVEDKSGRLLSTAVLTEEYYDLQQEDYDTAGERFMEKYGPDAILAIIPQSGASTYGIPRNQAQLSFVINHPKLKGLFPSTYGFFLPQSDEFDYDVYLKSFMTGEREDLSPDQWLNLANNMRGDMLFRHYKDQLGGRNDKAARDYLRKVRQKILAQYPSGPTGLPEKPDTAALVRELYHAVKDSTIRSTDAGEGLALYLKYRDAAVAQAKAAGKDTSSGLLSSSQELEGTRQWLDNVAHKVIDKHPDFQFLWDIVFSREVDLNE